MKTLNETDKLNETIALLEAKQTYELIDLKNHFDATYESLKLINFVKTTFRNLIKSPDIKQNILSSVVGLTTGYLSKKVLIGSTHNPIKKVLGGILQFVITNIAAKKAATISKIEEEKSQIEIEK